MKPHDALTSARIPLVYIHSASHSGSTLLALQLARHPHVCTVGELSGTRYRARPGYRCSCGHELAQCSFWRAVSAAMASRGFRYDPSTAGTDVRNASSPYLRRLLKPLHRGPLLELVRDVGIALVPGGRSYIREHQQLKAALVESVVECAGRRVLVDSSKSGVQLKYHLRNPRFDVKVVWLVRDGRGVTVSIMRNQGASLPQAAYQWRRTNEEARAVVRRLDPSQWIQIRYEALCADPEGTLRRLWQFVDVPSHEADDGAGGEYHVLGHRMRLQAGSSIRLNEKWRTELSAPDLRAFEAVAGRLNRELGYR